MAKRRNSKSTKHHSKRRLHGGLFDNLRKSWSDARSSYAVNQGATNAANALAKQAAMKQAALQNFCAISDFSSNPACASVGGRKKKRTSKSKKSKKSRSRSRSKRRYH